jgi:transposase
VLPRRLTSSQAGTDTVAEKGTTAVSMLAEEYDYVIGGDPDRDTIDLAVLDAASAGVRAHLSGATNAAGYVQVLAWANEQAPGSRLWALEGTGNYGAGLASFLAEAGEDVVEIDRVKRARRGGKNDQIDAVRAAREALSRDTQVRPRQRGLREALRVVLTTRHAVLVSRTKAINELKALIVTAPEHLRGGLRGRPLTTQLTRIEQLHASATSTLEHQMTIFTLRSVAARIAFLTDQIDELDPQLAMLVHTHPSGTALLLEPGVGPVVAAQLLISWSHAGRVRSEAAFAALAGVSPLEASSGQRARHRLNRGGDRALNRALHTVALTRLRCHPETREYAERRTRAGKTHREIKRCLKRSIARRLYRRIQAAAPIAPATT